MPRLIAQALHSGSCTSKSSVWLFSLNPCRYRHILGGGYQFSRRAVVEPRCLAGHSRGAHKDLFLFRRHARRRTMNGRTQGWLVPTRGTPAMHKGTPGMIGRKMPIAPTPINARPVTTLTFRHTASASRCSLIRSAKGGAPLPRRREHTGPPPARPGAGPAGSVPRIPRRGRRSHLAPSPRP